MIRLARPMRHRLLSALEGIHSGRLRLTTPEGNVHHFGTSGEDADLAIHDWGVLAGLVAQGETALAGSWVAGRWDSSSVEGIVALALRNRDSIGQGAEGRPLVRFALRLADMTRAGRAAPHPGNEFFQLWLDSGMSYSGALFAPGDGDLDRAQERKHGRILSRLGSADDVLDLGCGWGGFAEAAAQRGRRVTGLTQSPAQKGYADARLDGRADIRLSGYRGIDGRFGNIVAIEAMESGGERDWPEFFTTIRDRLAEGGRAVVQAVTVPDSEYSICRTRPDFIRLKRAPAGILPCDAVIAREAGEAGLAMRGHFAFGQDYARTCRIWADRLMAARPRLLRHGYDVSVLRRWQVCLEGAAATFATGRADVVQVDLCHASEIAA